MAIFVQLGAARDGSDPYLRTAHSWGMKAVLIETPDYIRLRKALKRQEFDQTITVEHPSDPYQVAEAITQLPETPTLLLAGFERYIYSAYAAARMLRTLPYFPEDTFIPLNKAEQRIAISHANTSILQPKYYVLSDHDISAQKLTDFCYPLVVKPIDGGGGLGVFFVSNFEEVEEALSELQSITNYDGGAFQGIEVEEYVSGDEYSVQGLVQDGQSTILTFCKKFVLIEPAANAQPLHSFREVGHIAIRGDRVGAPIKQFAQTCVDVFKYKNGPFHIDMVRSSPRYYHLEMGFRLSGFGLVRLVQRVSGYDWAEETFASHLGKPALQSAQPSESPYMGQFTAVSQTEIDNARQLQSLGHRIEIQLFNNPELTNTSNRLKSDLTRHAGSIGRITALAATFEEVENLLKTCSPGRTTEKREIGSFSGDFSLFKKGLYR